MKKPALVVMAAGVGSRYGGLKQIDPIGPGGEIIMDYSIYDALLADFGKVVFVIKKEMEDIFREKIGKRIEKHIDTDYVFQRIDDVPAGFLVPPERTKPWGTAHAVMSCRKHIDTPFGVINADDFYGRSSFEALGSYLKKARMDSEISDYCMAGFILENTLTEHGHVARGVCKVDDNGYLEAIKERTRIQRFGAHTKYTEDGENWVELPEGCTVSMNMWGFTPDILGVLEERFPDFLKKNHENILKAEYFLPDVVGSLLLEKKARVKVLETRERWYGVTYQDDKPMVKQAVGEMVRKGIYPEKLWGGI